MTRPRAAATLIVTAALMVTACGSNNDRSSAPNVTFATAPSTIASTPSSATTSSATTSSATTSSATTSPTIGTTGPTTSTTAASANVPARRGDPSIALPALANVANALGGAVRPGDPTLYVVTQDGRIVPVRDGKAGGPVLDITHLTEASGERGLLGLAFHPTAPLAYVDYTDNHGNTVIAEFAVAADGTFAMSSRREVLGIDQPYPNHNGGQVAFGPDGFLYIGMGDGGSANDPQRRAIDAGKLLGKILRIDPRASGDQPYTVPADNPFVGIAGARPEIWSVGVRNPWRFSFDPATKDLWIADVGQGGWEEIDAAWADQGAGRGVNFGWSAFEGTHRFNGDQSADGVTPPIYEYPHGDAGCSVSGGAVYRGAAIPALVGWYVFGDYCSGQITALQITDRQVVKTLVLGSVPAVAAIVAGPDGELYAMSPSDGVHQIVAA